MISGSEKMCVQALTSCAKSLLRDKKDVTELSNNAKAQTENENSAIKMLPGFIVRAKVRCGRSNCRCSRGIRHIAYYHVTYNAGIRIRKYVRREEVADLRVACEAHRELQRQLRAARAEYRQVLARARDLLKLSLQ